MVPTRTWDDYLRGPDIFRQWIMEQLRPGLPPDPFGQKLLPARPGNKFCPGISVFGTSRKHLGKPFYDHLYAQEMFRMTEPAIARKPRRFRIRNPMMACAVNNASRNSNKKANALFRII